MVKLKEVVDATIGINEAASQVRWFACREHNEEYYHVDHLPKLDGVMEAAGWLRRNGHLCFTNQSFRGLLSDIIGRMVSEEEAHTARVLTGFSANLAISQSCSIFVTDEEWNYIEHMVKDGILYPAQIIHNDTMLGVYVELIP